MFKNKKINIFFLCLLFLGITLWIFNRNKVIEVKPNPVPLDVIKSLAEQYKPTVVFQQNPLFYPVKFDGLKKIALEVDKQVVAELDITDKLKNASNKLNHPRDLFESAPANSIIYYYSLSTIPEQWATEKVLNSFPDTLSLYVNASYDQYLKISYTIPFEGNQWRNNHRGDGAIFALYFDKKGKNYQPILARSYMHLQHSEINYKENITSTSQEKDRPVFFVTSGSHSTYHRAGHYENVDGLPFLRVGESTKNEFAYCNNRTQLVFTDVTRNNIEKWAFLGEVYWGGSPNDRILAKDNFIKKIPLLRSIPLGNKSAKMTYDPSAVFDRKSYNSSDLNLEKVMVNCD